MYNSLKTHNQSNFFNSKCKVLPEPSPVQNDLHVPHGNELPLTLNQLQGIMDDYANQKQWDDREIHTLDSTGNQIDRKSAEYWERVNAENNKALSSMTDEQKKMLSDIGNMFPPSMFEPED